MTFRCSIRLITDFSAEIMEAKGRDDIHNVKINQIRLSTKNSIFKYIYILKLERNWHVKKNKNWEK